PATEPRSVVIDSASLTSITIPCPLTPARCKLAVICSAPEVEVAVPTTVMPCRPNLSAIAAPMPRLAPVTKATRCSLIPDSPGSIILFELLGQVLQQRGGVRSVCFNFAFNALDQTTEDFTGPTFDCERNSLRVQHIDAVYPPNRRIYLLNQQ